MGHEASSGIILIVAAALAIALDNSPLAWLYDSLLTTPVVVQIGTLGVDVAVSPHAITVSTILQHVRRGRIRAIMIGNRR